ncbi:DNA primase family protein [Arcobacter peruensis]|uniref:DNA primase family protein n=1 Tax=Arcobacter peruensis TaxID=2320140 RepID=UPI000F07712C|nr:phage/plasmid primase, P4 family [Arcobacter peruensis]
MFNKNEFKKDMQVNKDTSSNEQIKPKDEVITNKNDNNIIPKKSSLTLTPGELLSLMVESIPSNIQLISVLNREIKDPLVKYQKNGEIEISKVPATLYIVAIVYKLLEVAETKGWDIAREYDFIYLYNGVFWIQCIKDDLYKFFNRISKKMNYYSPAQAETHKFKDDLYKQFIASSGFYAPIKKENTVLLNCLNGTLEVTENKVNLRPHKKEDFLKYVLTFNYNKKAIAPIFKQYLDDVLDKETQTILQEYAGYIFINHLKLEKALILYGSGANGKSVFFEVIKSLLGDTNISMMSLGDLTDKNNGEANRALLKDKLVNYGSEIKGKNIDIDTFKRLVSGEPVQARLKYGNPFYLEGNTKLIFNANELPSINEHNEAVFRRFIIIPFDKTIPIEKRDTELHSKIIENELSGVLNWILEGLERLLKNKKFSDSKKTNEALAEYKKESDSVALFVEENEYSKTVIEDYFESIADLYEAYRISTREAGKNPLSKINFSKRLKNLGFIPYTKKINGKTKKGYLIKAA